MDQALAKESDIAREYYEQQVAQQMVRYYELLKEDVPPKIRAVAES